MAALSLDTQRTLKHLLVHFSCQELMIEHLREELATLDQFTLYGCFRRLVSDRHKKHLEAAALIKFMGENGYAWVTFPEAALFITEFANESQREAEGTEGEAGVNLSFAELQRCFLPAESDDLRAALSQKEVNTQQAYLPLLIEEKIALLIAKEIEFLQVGEQMRTELEERFDFSTYACFSAIVNSDSGAADKSRITEVALGKYLVKNGYYATDRELGAMLRRMDIDQDGKVLYGDLSEYIKPRILPITPAQVKVQAVKPNPVANSSSPLRRSSQSPKQKSPNRVRFSLEETKTNELTDSKQPLLTQNPSQSPIQVYSSTSALLQPEDDRLTGSFHHVRRQLESEVLQERNAKILEESLELVKKDAERTKPQLRQDDAVSILSYLFQWADSLVDKVKDQIVLQREIERIKDQLVEEHMDFNLYDAWEVLDKHRKGFVTPLDLIEGLDDINVLGMPEQAKDSAVNRFLSVYGKTESQGRLRFADFTSLVGPGQNVYLLKILTARNPSGFYFRGDSLLLYRRLWKLLFDNIELLEEAQKSIWQTISQATLKHENVLKIKAALTAIGLEEKAHIRDELELRLRFYASAQEIQQVASSIFVQAAKQIITH